MKVRDLTQVGILLAVGYLLHLVVPGIIFGMKPDLTLGMLFIILMIYREVKIGLAAGLAAGIISAATTSFPGGQIPNVIDKILTTLLVLGLIYLLQNLQPNVLSAVVGAVGTLISGTIFLGAAALIAGLPGPFAALFMGAVLPATLVNTIAVVILYPIVTASRRLAGSDAAAERQA